MSGDGVGSVLPQAQGGEVLAVSRDGAIATVTLKRPGQFNALSEQLLADLTTRFHALAQDESVRVVILAAEGKAFCAGHDLREMMQAPSTGYYQSLFQQCTKMMMAIQKMPQPVIARVHGIATAAGCQLVAMCDLAYAATTARFAVSGVNLGLFCSTPSVPLSRNLSRKHAFEMLVTGRFIEAAEAKEKGLINEVCPPEELDAVIGDVASAICAKPAVAIAAGKQLFYRQIETGIEAAYQMAGQTMACNMMAPDTLEGVQAFLEKRAPDWR